MDYVIFSLLVLVGFAALHFWLRRSGRMLGVPVWTWLAVGGLLAAGWFHTRAAGEKASRQVREILEGFPPTYAQEIERLGHAQITTTTRADDPAYLAIIAAEIRWLHVNPAIADIYTLRKLPDGRNAFIVDSETDYNHDGKFEGEHEQRTPIGEIYPEADAGLERAFRGEANFDDMPITDRWGTWISAFVPLHDASGRVEAVLGVDFPAAAWIRAIAQARLSAMVELFVVAMILGSASAVITLLRTDLRHRILEEERGRQLNAELERRVEERTAELVATTGNLQDKITERRLMETDLLRLAAIVEYSDDAIIGKDLTGRITSWNAGAERLFGYSADEIVGSQVTRLIPSDRQSEEETIMDRIRSGERLEHFDTVRQTKDGRSLDVSVTASAIRNASGQIIGASKVARDITERKQAESALRASETRFRSLFEQAAVGVMLIDVATGLFVEVNQRFCTISGRSREELLQLSFAGITDPRDISRSLEFSQQLSVGAIRECAFEKRYLRKDGSVMWANVTASAMWAVGATPTYYLSIVEDITERKKLEEQYHQAQKMEAIGTLAGGIAHDFNNILGAIIGYAQLAKMELDGSPVVEHLDAVLVAAKRATDLVKQILAFSRRQEYERKVIQLGPVVVEAIALLRATIPPTIGFETSVATNLPNVLANASQIHQVVMNLCVNAAHAMKGRSGRLTVRLEDCVVGPELTGTNPGFLPGPFVCLTVSDNGHGMDEATLARIYEPFFTTKPPGEGTGLGLSAVHGIMRSHEGVVTVSSVPDEGTTFRLYFPTFIGEAAVETAVLGEVPCGRGERILYVDDEVPLMLLGQKILQRLGYVIDARTKPSEALEAVRTKPGAFDLVVTDQLMPVMVGTSLAMQIHLIRPDLPIILVTGHTATLTAERLKICGITKLLMKPFTVETLGRLIHQVLNENKI